MKRANSNLTKSLQRLSSGKRIVSPADDAGGLAVGMKLQSSLKRAAASRMNTQNGTSFLQMQDSVMKVAGEILDRMSELKSFFNDVSKGPDDRETYNHEFTELQKELNSLKSQKFNGVSLFATREPDNNPLKIITSDDGLGEHIELKRTGFFENLKSKYGADGKLNTGSNGSFRQLVGEFTADGGLADANPGFASRDYKEGQVVFKAGGLANQSGYYMALTHVKAGVAIEDTALPTSQWIRIADAQGVGFAEAYPSSPEYDTNSIKYNSSGEQMAYLKGDKIKVPAHWASPGSFLFLEAQADVPRGLTLSDIFALDANGDASHIGDSKYFKYVGEDTSNGSKPTTEYIRANINLPEPSFYGGSALQLINSIKSNTNNGYNPTYVRTTDNNIYTPAFDWNLKSFDTQTAYNYGETVFKDGDNTIHEMHSSVKGQWGAQQYGQGEYVFRAGQWFQVTGANGATKDDMPYNPDADSVRTYLASTGYQEGMPILVEHDDDDPTTDINQVFVASSLMKGAFESTYQTGDYAPNDVVQEGVKFWEWQQDPPSTYQHGDFGNNAVVRYGGQFYQANSSLTGTTVNPKDDTTNWTPLGSNVANLPAAFVTDVTDQVEADATRQSVGTVTPQAAANAYFVASPFQAYSNDGSLTHIGDPTLNLEHDGATANAGTVVKTDMFRDVNNSTYWTKTHFGSLNGVTVGSSYQYGDNIHYQGKNYIYTSNLSSEHYTYLRGADPSTGYTEFENLLELGAVRELPMYVDTMGGGGNGSLPEGVYYKPNQDLQYGERISDSGMVRTSGAERRTDAPNPPGDDIYASADDQFYGGLNAGNDGIYGTADDFYATTVDPNISRNGGQIDADADNNKDLLDENLDLQDFSVADFVDYIQNLANVRAVNGGTMSRLGYAQRILEENEINLGAATSRIMDADMAYESTRMASHNVLLQAAASMVTQANSLNSVVLSLLQ